MSEEIIDFLPPGLGDFSFPPIPEESLLCGLSLQDTIKNAKLIIVDDETANVALLTDILNDAGFVHIYGTQNPFEVVQLYKEVAPDLILLDLMMPGKDGFTVIDELKSVFGGRIDVPIVVLTADVTQKTKQLALERGAKDYITRTFAHDA